MNYLYQITNLINNKIYIGVHKTNNIDDNYMGSGSAIKLAINKYGIENFKKDILEFFDTYEAALLEEEEIVDKDFIIRDDVYNLRIGGVGGFEHINNVPVKERKNVKELKRKIASGELKVGGSDNWTDEGRRRIIEVARKNAPLANALANTPKSRIKRKNTYKEINHQAGLNNSQYGRYWISNIETKEIRRINKDNLIPVGWVRGKKGHKIDVCWVNNGIEEKLIKLDKKEEYVKQGYISGRFKSSMPKEL